MTLGDKIRKLRLQNNLTQNDLAERVGKLPSHISRYENGRVRPSRRTIALLAEALGVSNDELLKDAPRPASDGFRDRELARLMRELDDMEEKDRGAVKTLLEALVMKKNLREQLLKTGT